MCLWIFVVFLIMFFIVLIYVVVVLFYQLVVCFDDVICFYVVFDEIGGYLIVVVLKIGYFDFGLVGL